MATDTTTMLKTRALCAQAQADLLTKQVAQVAESTARGGEVATPTLVDPRSFKREFAEELRPYIPRDLFPDGQGGDDVRAFWATDKKGRVNLYQSLQDNLAAIDEARGGSRDGVANNSYEAAENLRTHVVKAVRAVEGRNWSDAADNGLRAVKDLGQVAGHLSAGN